MPVRVRIPRGSTRSRQWRTGHKPLALAYSVALHGLLVALAFLPSSGVEQDSVYRAAVIELEKDHKLIYYDFRKELPEVSPADATGKRTTPGPDALKSKQTIVTNPNEKPGKQLVYIPEPRVKLEAELQAPNLIAIEPEITVPLPDRPKPRPFQAPEQSKNAPPRLTPLPNAPAVPENANDSALKALLNKPAGLPPKQFVPPSQKAAAAPVAPVALPNAPKVGPGTADQNAAVAALLDRPTGPPPKQFVAPAGRAAQGAAAPVPLPNAPTVATGSADKNSSIAALLDKPPGAPLRAFTAPQERTQKENGGSGSGGAPLLPNAPAVGGGGQNSNAGGTAISGILKGPAGPPPKPFTAPPGRTPGAGGNGSGSAAPALPAAPSLAGASQPASATVAIIGLNPSNVPQIPKPEGSRPARIEAGTPLPGATHAELGGGNSGISMPGVSIQGGPATSLATASRTPLDRSTSQPAAGLATPQAPQVLPTTPHVSVPQWPNTRILPAAIEHHFQNRVVYLTSIPSAHGSEDWILWFAELTVTPRDPSQVVNPPILLKLGPLPPFPAQSDHGTGHIRLTGIISKDGHLGSVTELAGDVADRELIEALQGWQFSPARRNGVTMDTDAVIEIPVVFGKLSLR